MSADPTNTKLEDWPLRRLARVVIEFTTPLHVGTGRGGEGIDALVVTDANGLPAIPGSSLAGALRAATSPALRNSLFGYQDRNKGLGSRLTVSWACIHDSTNTPVEGVTGESRRADPILVNALAPRLRDHVRLHHQGAQDAEQHGKFDEWPVCAGHRFTFELELVSQETQFEDTAWKQLLDVLRGGSLRLGGKTRRGFGSFRVAALRQHIYNLSERNGFAAYLDRPVSLADPLPPAQLESNEPPSPAAELTATLTLTPVGYWMFGGGDDPKGEAKSGKAPVRDDSIVWTKDRGTVRRDLLLPGSAIKGALAHRVVWHWNKATSNWIDAAKGSLAKDAKAWAKAREDAAYTGEDNPAVQELFGFQKSKTDGRRGRVLIDDVFVTATEQCDQLAPHVAIDRVTGGAIDNRLFMDRPLWQAPNALVITLTILGTASDSISAAARAALLAALDDVCHGRLALGAGGGRGMGYFTGEVAWNDGGRWAGETSATPLGKEAVP